MKVDAVIQNTFVANFVIQVRIQQAIQSGLWDSFVGEEKEDFVSGAMIMETNRKHIVETENFKQELRSQINSL